MNETHEKNSKRSYPSSPRHGLNDAVPPIRLCKNVQALLGGIQPGSRSTSGGACLAIEDLLTGLRLASCQRLWGFGFGEAGSAPPPPPPSHPSFLPVQQASRSHDIHEPCTRPSALRSENWGKNPEE